MSSFTMEKITTPRVYKLGLALILGAIVFSQAIYALGWDNQLVSDDWFFIYGVSQVNSAAQLLALASFQTSWFVRPTQWLLTFILYSIFGIAPYGYHIVSQALDLANAFLVGLLMFQILSLSKRQTKATRVLLSALVTCLFLLSWRHHEAVYWYSAVNELLAAMFKLLALNAAAWWLARRTHYWIVASVSLLATGLAILSKESALLLPLETLLLVLFAAFADRPRPPDWKRGALLVGAQMSSLASGPISILRQATSILRQATLIRNELRGAGYKFSMPRPLSGLYV